MVKNLLIFGLLFYCSLVFSWNKVGHRVVAQIAYNHLTPEAKRQVNRLNHAMDIVYQPQSFVTAASWMDDIKTRNIRVYDTWHYIDIPFTTDNSPVPSIDKVNAVWALDEAFKNLNSKTTNTFEKGFFLRVLIHVFGDIHQPLHTIDKISRENPHGDQGGNLFLLAHNKVGRNLHAYWDRGAGLFIAKKRYFSRKKIKQLARRIERQYPMPSTLKNSFNFMAVAKESNRLAKQRVYALSPQKKPSKNYQQQAQTLVIQQVALSGYRLSVLLNTLLG